jgi:LPXTG-motif cell wall-anchored protein
MSRTAIAFWAVAAAAAAIVTVPAAGSAAAEPLPGPTATPGPISAEPPRTNIRAVFDPVAVAVSGGVRVRVGARNAGPGSIHAPEGTPAVAFQLDIYHPGYVDRVRSLGGCGYAVSHRGEIPHSFFTCNSGPTLRAGDTYWQSFVFPDLSGFTQGVHLAVGGYVDDTRTDNTVDVVVRLGHPAGRLQLPATGNRPVLIGAAGLAMLLTGSLAFWSARRRRARFTTA